MRRQLQLSDECSNLEATSRAALQRFVPEDDLARLLVRCPRLLETDVAALTEFLRAYGIQDWRIKQMLCTHPELLAERNVYEVGQLFQVLNQLDMFAQSDLPQILTSGATAASAAAMAAHLARDHFPAQPDSLRMCLNRWPELLAQPVERFAARVAALRALEPLRGLTSDQAARLRDSQMGWIPTAVEWDTVVQPRITYLAEVLGVQDAHAFLADAPIILVTPLFPTSDATRSLSGTVDVLTTLLDPPDAAADGTHAAGCRHWVVPLLRACPEVLAQSPLELRALCNFLVDVIGGGADEVASWPEYLAQSLETGVGPRYCFLHARRLVGGFSGGAAGALDLRRVFGVSLADFLEDARQQCEDSDLAALQQAYEEAQQAWQDSIGSVSVAAFSGLRPQHKARLNTFYMYLA